MNMFMLAQLVVQKRRRKQGRCTARNRMTTVPLMTVLAMLSIEDDMYCKREAFTFPSAGTPALTPTYGIESTYWQTNRRFSFLVSDFDSQI